jgi:hypothetical protein
VEGPLAIVSLMPEAVLPGWVGSSLDEDRWFGSAGYEGASGVITVRGSGSDRAPTGDRGYFLRRRVEGDFQLTVTMLTRPAGGTDPRAGAGLMIRESLDPGGRTASLMVHHGPAGLRFQWRPSRDAWAQSRPPLPEAALRLPILLRLTRRGDTLTAGYSKDDGKSWRPAGEAVRFEEPLPRSVYAGLAVTSHREGEISAARFRGVRIRSGVISPGD